MPRLLALAAALLPILATPAGAATTLTVDSSTAILGVRALAGVAVVDANLPCTDLEFPDTVEQCSFTGSLGAIDTLPMNTTPGLLAIAGSGTANAQDFLWGAMLNLEWSSWQQHGWSTSADALVLSGGGRHQSTLFSEVFGPEILPGTPGTRAVEVLNLHTLVFTLDATTGVTYSSSWSGGYMPVQLSRLDVATGEFVGENNIPFSGTSSLDAGTYRLRNWQLLQRNLEDNWDLRWDYSLSFHSTTLAVPEAPSLALLAAGLAAIGWRRRQQARGLPAVAS
jgi:hypothetical protein